MQVTGTVVHIGAGITRTVISLSTTQAEESNAVLDQRDWVHHLLREVKIPDFPSATLQPCLPKIERVLARWPRRET